MGKCLYVSDLDGTLLRSDETISPYSCAVSNAVEELKQVATKVIGSNNDDGVAKWLAQRI